MNMRKRKLVVMAAMYYIADNARWDRWINQILAPTPEEVAAQQERFRASFEAMMRPQIEPSPAAMEVLKKQAAAKIYKVARVKDNEVVLETEDLAEAQESIEKAARQKKAKLHLLDDDALVQYDAKNFVHMV